MKIMLGLDIMPETIEKTTKISKKKYFSNIREEMIYLVRCNLSYDIKEDMLIFDKYGMVTGLDLSTNENKRIFNKAEYKLEYKYKNEQYSRNCLS